MKKYPQALECAEEAIRINSKFVDAWNEKGDILKAMDRIDEAEQCFAKAKELEEE